MNFGKYSDSCHDSWILTHKVCSSSNSWRPNWYTFYHFQYRGKTLGQVFVLLVIVISSLTLRIAAWSLFIILKFFFKRDPKHSLACGLLIATLGTTFWKCWVGQILKHLTQNTVFNINYDLSIAVILSLVLNRQACKHMPY